LTTKWAEYIIISLMHTYEYMGGVRDVVIVMCGFSLIVMGCNSSSSDTENAPETAIEECKTVSDTVVAWTESTVLGVPKEEVIGNESEVFSGVFASWTDTDESGG
jgi:hypothetical protein